MSCESAGDARWGYLNMTVRDHARLDCDLSVIDRFLSNVFVINVYRELLRQPVSHNPSLRIDFLEVSCQKPHGSSVCVL